MDKMLRLTCLACGALNPRPLPYDMRAPDTCTACGEEFHKPLPRRGDWIQTVSGRQYWPLDPRADEIDIGDVAHALGMLCRYTGHCSRFYSVAEHSVHVSVVVELEVQRQANRGGYFPRVRPAALVGLLHDGPEAYINDIARPVKRSIVGYDIIEAANWAAFVEHFSLPDSPELHELVKWADNAVLLAEMGALMLPPPQPWPPVESIAEMVADAHAQLAFAGEGWGPDRAKWEFMQRYEALT